MNEQYSKVSVTKLGGDSISSGGGCGELNLPSLISHRDTAPAPETKTIIIDTTRPGYAGDGGSLEHLDLSSRISGVGGKDVDLEQIYQTPKMDVSEFHEDMSGGGGDGLETIDLTQEMGDDMSGGGGVGLETIDLTQEMGDDMSGGGGLEPAVDLTPSIDLAPALIDVGNELTETITKQPNYLFDTYEMYHIGGGKKDYNDFNFEYTDNVIEDYQKYIGQYEKFRSEEKSKGKYTYSVKDGNMIKTNSSGKELTNIKQPTYININKIERLLANDIDALLFKLKQQRDEILLTKNLVKLDAFNKIRKEYIELIILLI